jgi:dipeptidyl aminopeptidase/acylaminoacyl peptidase
MRRLTRIAVKAACTYTAMSLVVAIVMAEMTLHPLRLPLPSQGRIAALYKPYGAALQSVAIQAADGVELHGWYSVPEHQNGQAVILFHGIGDNRGGVVGYGQVFLQKGYRILLPDSRAHGESGGAMATYGLLESDDIHRWVSWLYGEGAGCVDGFGESMGAALVLESLGSESRFCAVVAESAFSNFRSVAYDREGYFVGAGRFGMRELLEERSASYPPSWLFSTLAGTMESICGGPTQRMR